MTVGFVNESLRCRPPLKRVMGRRAQCDIELPGETIPRDALILMDIYAAHHDPSVYNEPDQFELNRTGPPVLAFGFGAHACLGAALARLEARTLIDLLLSQFTIHAESKAVDSDSREWSEFEILPIRLEPLAGTKRTD
jgi:cytochrome P450